jgi:hypothetical protein
MRIGILGGIVFIALATVAQAKVYKWTDAQGKVHYSANPPTHMKAQEIKVAPPPPSAQTAPQAQVGEPKSEAESTQPTAATDDKARAEAFRKNCEIARQNLTILEDPANRRFSQDGKQSVYYTNEQRAEKIAQANKSIEAYCKDAGKQ